MADAVAAAIAGKRHLVRRGRHGRRQELRLSRAGDPGGDRSRRSTSRRGWSISTHTISLQEQLISKDLPLLNSVIPREFSAVLVKGRRNYLSLRRLQAALARGEQPVRRRRRREQLRDDPRLERARPTTARWPTSTYKPLPAVWDEVASDHGNCMGRRCPTYNKCFYYQDRRRVQHAQILVVNHALFFSDLALRRQGVSILPDYDVVVLDEAHTVEAVAADHLGLSLTSGQVEYVLSRLYNDRTQQGAAGAPRAASRCASASSSAATPRASSSPTCGSGRASGAGERPRRRAAGRRRTS